MVKPHIKMIGGWWRVTAMPKPYWKHSLIWTRAHRLVNKLNNRNHHNA